MRLEGKSCGSLPLLACNPQMRGKQAQVFFSLAVNLPATKSENWGANQPSLGLILGHLFSLVLGF